MIFTIFRDFSGFFQFYFRFKTFKINKNDKKRLFFARVPCECDVALRATWQRHAGPRGAYAAYLFIYIYIIYIVRVFSLPYIGRVFKPSNLSGVINPIDFFHFFCVGLSPTQLS